MMFTSSIVPVAPSNTPMASFNAKRAPPCSIHCPRVAAIRSTLLHSQTPMPSPLAISQVTTLSRVKTEKNSRLNAAYAMPKKLFNNTKRTSLRVMAGIFPGACVQGFDRHATGRSGGKHDLLRCSGLCVQESAHLRLQPLRIVPHQEMVAAFAQLDAHAGELGVLRAVDRGGRLPGGAILRIGRPCAEHQR